MAAETTFKKIDMPYVNLGKSGLKVSRLILGCMGFGSKEWAGWVVDEKESIPVLKAAYAAGINTWDTADVYSNGHSEIIVGKAIKEIGAPRENFVIMTKLWFHHAGPEYPGVKFTGDANQHGLVNRGGLSRKHIFASVQASLKRLDLDYVDVLQCHRFDPDTPIEETMQALHDVVKAGWVRYIGMSSCYAWQFQAMQNYAIANKLTPFISMQNHHSLLYREEEREMNPLCQHLGVGTIPWSPLARGLLTRPWDAQTLRAETDAWIGVNPRNDASKAIVNRVEEIAKKKNVTMAQIAVAWVLSQPAVTAPIVGTTNIEKLQDLIAGVYITLTPEEIKYLGEPYVSRSIAGH